MVVNSKPHDSITDSTTGSTAMLASDDNGSGDGETKIGGEAGLAQGGEGVREGDRRSRGRRRSVFRIKYDAQVINRRAALLLIHSYKWIKPAGHVPQKQPIQ